MDGLFVVHINGEAAFKPSKPGIASWRNKDVCRTCCNKIYSAAMFEFNKLKHGNTDTAHKHRLVEELSSSGISNGPLRIVRGIIMRSNGVASQTSLTDWIVDNWIEITGTKGVTFKVSKLLSNLVESETGISLSAVSNPKHYEWRYDHGKIVADTRTHNVLDNILDELPVPPDMSPEEHVSMLVSTNGVRWLSEIKYCGSKTVYDLLRALKEAGHPVHDIQSGIYYGDDESGHE